MTFISLRRPDPEPDPDDPLEATEPDEDTEDDGAQEQEPEGTSLGLLPALYQGVCGWCTWCSARIGVGWTYTVHGVALWAACYYDAWVAFGVAGTFVLVTVLFTPREPFDRLADRIEARVEARATGPDESAEDYLDESAEEGAEEPPADPLLELMWRLIGEAPGVHLKTLREVLAESSAKEGQRPPSKTDVEAALEARGIPLRPSVRDVRDKVNKGVHRGDLDEWQKALSQPETTPPGTSP
ncbi:hypothetical protein [Streptomyces cavernae]|uniref:hypothetical protein n=1 Tax=Streptomyces cavernae TaxID=2259034 RepID=UPI000FEC159B|nr:hypothetical protein [Streptomyces cavernae]